LESSDSLAGLRSLIRGIKNRIWIVTDEDALTVDIINVLETIAERIEELEHEIEKIRSEREGS